LSPDQLVNNVVEAALFSEFTENITAYSAYEDMRNTITAALLRDTELKEKIINLADKYRRTEHTH